MWQYVAVSCNVGQCDAARRQLVCGQCMAVRGSVLQCVAECCSVLQLVVHCDDARLATIWLNLVLFALFKFF